jgi:hypothetical protein
MSLGTRFHPRRRFILAAVAALTLAAALVTLAPLAAQEQSTAPAATAPATPPGDEPLPDLKTVLDKVRAGIRLDREIQGQYTYLEKRRDLKVSRLGKVQMGPQRTFEVYPSSKPGRTYKRLIEVDGKPLDRAELDRRDEEHRQHVLSMIEAEKNEQPADREKRLKKEAEDTRKQHEIVDDGFAVYEAKLVGREMLDGHRMLVATLTPRPNAKTRSDEGNWMKKFKGRAWVAEDDYQIAKIEMEAIDDITLGLGLVGRVHEGSRFTFKRTKVNGEAWLPVEATFEASGRTLIFRSFKVSTTTTFSDYKKFNVDTTTTYDLPKEDKR